MIDLIGISFIFLVSIGLLLWGSKRKGIARMSLGGALVLLGFFILLDRFPQYANTFNAWATLVLALVAFVAVSVTIDLERRRRKDERKKEERERKDRILNEIINWIFSIKDITLEPITEDNIAFRQFNIELKYGVPLDRFQLLEMETEQIINNQDLKKRLLKVAELLVAVMVLDKAKYMVGDVDKNLFKAFPGFVNTIEELSSMIEEEVTKGKKGKAVIVADMWLKYTIELNNAEATVLEKIVSIKSDLLKS